MADPASSIEHQTDRPRRRRRPMRRLLTLVLIASVGYFLGWPAVRLFVTYLNDPRHADTTRPGYINDASRLNETKVLEVIDIPADPQKAEQQLAQLLARAKRENKKVSIAGARHTMGGHTIAADGIVLNMLPFNDMELDEANDILKVQAGARWSEVLPYLDKRGRSVAVMQSNSSFSVGGSISANCHGWQHGRPPIASTVRSFRLMQADGSVVKCSRQENAELFSLVMGGYGLFGVILDVELNVIPNERYRLEQFVVPIAEALSMYDEKVLAHPEAQMVYARMNITEAEFLNELIINVFYQDFSGGMPELSQPGLADLRRAIFRGSAEDDYGKRLRWNAETTLQPYLSAQFFSRNQLLSEGTELFENRSATSTDILHEYFVPAEGLPQFVAAMKQIIPAGGGNLLNVTVRMVSEDRDCFLRYVDQELFSFVLLFQQQRTAQGEQQMQSLAQQLIDAADAAGGRYYLPYRLHATPAQFRRAYPQSDKFFELKRQYDPNELFQNAFYAKYGQLIVTAEAN